MKKITIVALMLALLIVNAGCIKENGSVSEETMNTGAYFDDLQSSVTESNDEVSECEAPGYFSNLSDFYKFATTGSREASDYSDEYTAQNIEWYPNVAAASLIKLESFLANDRMADQLDKIHILYTNDKYEYVLKNRVSITIEYGVNAQTAEEISEALSVSRPSVSCVIENSEKKFTPNVSGETVFLKETDGLLIQRESETSKYTGYVDFSTIFDGFKVSVRVNWKENYDSFDDFLKDPDNQYIASFYDDDQLSDAVAHIKEVISDSSNQTAE